MFFDQSHCIDYGNATLTSLMLMLIVSPYATPKTITVSVGMCLSTNTANFHSFYDKESNDCTKFGRQLDFKQCKRTS